jgi:hypothetical protein
VITRSVYVRVAAAIAIAVPAWLTTAVVSAPLAHAGDNGAFCLESGDPQQTTLPNVEQGPCQVKSTNLFEINILVGDSEGSLSYPNCSPTCGGPNQIGSAQWVVASPPCAAGKHVGYEAVADTSQGPASPQGELELIVCDQDYGIASNQAP